jgi:uncharacterized protein (TIGR04255 family)
MARQRHLPKAPITEALVDLRVKLPATFDVQAFGVVERRLHEDYPTVERMRLFQSSVHVAGDRVSHVASDRGLNGFLLRSSDTTQIAQFRLDGFTHNRLRPYTSWTEVRAEAWRLWHLYCEIANPLVVTRAAVRYINHFEIPESVETASYLTDPPTSPDRAARPMPHYLKRVVVEDPGTQLCAAVTQAVEPSAGTNQRSVLLDIDAYAGGEFAPDSSGLENALADLHDFKNQIFFGSLTEAAVEMFE